MAVAQGKGKLQEIVEKELLNRTVLERVRREMDAASLPSIVTTIVEAFAREGFQTNDLSVLLSQNAGSQVKAAIMRDIASRVEQADRIELRDTALPEGVAVVQREGNVSIEITPEAVSEVLLAYLRRDFRELFLKAGE